MDGEQEQDAFEKNEKQGDSAQKRDKNTKKSTVKATTVDYDLKSDECFCSKRKCFIQSSKGIRGRDIKETFSKIFFFIGKSLDERRSPAEKSDQLRQRKTLQRIEKMYCLAGSFCQKDPYIGNILAKTLIDQYVLYSDQLIFDNVYEKFQEF